MICFNYFAEKFYVAVTRVTEALGSC